MLRLTKEFQLRRVHKGSKRPKQQTQTPYGSELGPLYNTYVCVGWYSCGTANNWSEGWL